MSENFLFHNQESEFDFGGSCSLVAGVRCPAHGGTPMTVRTTRTAILLSRPFKCWDLDALSGRRAERGPVESGLPARRDTSGKDRIGRA